MKVWDMLIPTLYYQKFYIYVTNVWGENIPIYKGSKDDFVNGKIMGYGEGYNLLEHLMDEVDHYEVCQDGGILIQCRDENYNEHCDKLYDEKYVAKWDRNNPKTRPWREDTEIESWR